MTRAPAVASARPLRVLHCPTATAGTGGALARAERSVGLASHAVVFRENPYGFACDETLAPPGTSALRFEIRRWNLLRRALRDFDVVHFNFGRTILPGSASLESLRAIGAPGPLRAAYALYAGLFELRDLAWLRRAGKAIVATFQGDDARQGDYCRAHYAISPVSEVGPGYYDGESDRRKRARIARFGRYAHRIYALNPDLLNVLPGGARFLPYPHVDPRAWRREPTDPPRSGRLRLLHAPTHRGVKGTRFVIEAIERLRREGLDFEFRLVEGLPHAEARALYRSCDLLVDQLLVGWYGGLAVELLALETPVVCYLRESDLRHVPDAMRRELPFLVATPDSVCDVLRECLRAGREGLAARARAGRSFVERWHDPGRIGAGLRRDYEEILGLAPGGGAAPEGA